MELTNEHMEILKHTAKNGLFCGDSPEMQDLCDRKMMEYAGVKPFVPDPYFRLGPDGVTAIEDMRELDDQLRDDLVSKEREKRVFELEYSINKQLGDSPENMTIMTNYGEVPINAGDAEVVQQLLMKRFEAKINLHKSNT